MQYHSNYLTICPLVLPTSERISGVVLDGGGRRGERGDKAIKSKLAEVLYPPAPWDYNGVIILMYYISV